MEKELNLIGRGRMADVFAWEEGRILKLNHAIYPMGVAKKEFAASNAAQTAGVPVPAVYEIVERDGRCGVVFERVSDGSLLDVIKREPWKLGYCAKRLAELHARIHSCRILEGLESQKDYIRSAIEMAQGLTDEEQKTILNYLQMMPDGDRLCHGDYHPDNVLLSERGPLIIDWLTGTRGDPAADVCRTLIILETSFLPPSTPLFIRILQSVSRSWLTSTYLKRYLQHNPLDKTSIERWRLPLLAARIREVESFREEKSLVMAKIRLLLTNLTS